MSSDWGGWASGILVLLGSIIILLSSIGLIRLPDLYMRSHAATKSATLGVMFILAGAFVYFAVAHGLYSAKLLLGILFVFLTGPIAGHLNARAAYRTGVGMWNKSVRDDLKKALKKERLEAVPVKEEQTK